MKVLHGAVSPFIRILLICLFIPWSTGSCADTTSMGNARGIWMDSGQEEDSLFKWNAHWIWLPGSMENHAMLARRSFELDENPGTAILRISASDRYRLYVNGTCVCRGPARCAPHHQSYDILDLTKMMRKGRNTIAVRVHQQEGKWSYQYPGRAGLLVQLNCEGIKGEGEIRSDGHWKVVPDLSWSDDAPRISRFQDFVNDRVDMRVYDQEWTSTGFDDSGWSRARSLMRERGWPSPQDDALPQSLTPPWTSLVPRDIPYLEESYVRATNLAGAFIIPEPDRGPGTGSGSVSTFSVKDIPLVSMAGNQDEDPAREFRRELEKGTPLVLTALPEGECRVLVFDMGEVVIGFPRLEISGEAGTVVDVMSAPYILDSVFTHRIVDAECLDRIILSGKRDSWEATYFKPARYLALAIRNTSSETRVYAAGSVSIGYPFHEKGSISIPEAPWSEQYWEASMKTIRVCTTDGYTDNYRERRQYAQTGYYAALGNYWTFGDLALQRRYLVNVAWEQKANGIMPAYAPLAGNDFMIILDSDVLWIRSLRNYLLYSGDEMTVRELLPSAERLMELLHSYTDKGGMLDDPPFAYWIDHANLDRRGVSMALNGHYLGALLDYAQVLEWLGLPGPDIYRERAVKLRNSLRSLLWDPGMGLFADALVEGERSERFSEHGNALALALDIADEEQAISVLARLLKKEDHNFILRESGLTMVTPAMSYFLHRGLCEYGYIEESFEMFRDRFGHMLVEGANGTLWEEWFIDGTGRSGRLQKKTRSDAQTESAFPPALIVEYLFGIEPLKPGMRELGVGLKGTGLKKLEGRFPCPQGEIGIRWDLSESSGLLFLDIPEGMEVRLETLSLQQYAGNRVRVRDTRASTETRIPDDESRGYRLSSGEYRIEF